MDDKDFLSVENMVNFAMGLSMASLFARAMNNSGENLIRAIDGTSSQPPRYIYAMVNGQQAGPYSLGEVAEYIRQGAITPETYIWKAGMQTWRPAREVEDLAPALGSIPPAIPTL